MLKEKISVMEAAASEAFPVGSRVRIARSVVVYHHPEHRNQPFDLIGMEGTVVAQLREWQGREISANYPICVQFGPKFSVHLQEGELESL